MKKISLLILLVLHTCLVRAQVDYAFQAVSGNYVPLSGGTTPSLTAANPGGRDLLDESFANNVPLGFTIQYNGQNYTTIHLNSNGVASLGSPFVAAPVDPGYDQNELRAATGFRGVTRPALAPFWDNLSFASVTSLAYRTEGGAPNRVFTAQWQNMSWQGGAAALSFQIKLYESTNVIEFVYNREGSTGGANRSASIGITAQEGADLLGDGPGVFLSLNNTGNAPAASNAAETETLSDRPATGQVYRFTPSPCASPGGLRVVSYTQNSATISWTGRAGASGYQYGINNVEVQPGALNSTTQTSVTLNGLAPNQSYYFYVRSQCGSPARLVRFKTPTSATVPYTEGFEAALDNSLPSPMRRESLSNPFADIFWQTSSVVPAAGGSKAATNTAPFVPAQTWLYTPGLRLVGGTAYKVSFKYAGTGGTQAMDVRWGDKVGAVAMTNTIFTNESISSSNYQSASGSFVAPATGTYYVGFLCKSGINSGVLTLDDISITTDQNVVAVTGVTVSPMTVNLTSGATAPLTATVTPANASNKSVTWSTSNAAVASVNGSGLVTAVGAGAATITVTTNDGGRTATSAITVTAPTNTKPIAVLNASPVTGVAPLLTTFNANGSSDPDAGGSITGYEWNFGDGSAVSTATAPAHSYTAVGVYTATLRVKDNNNLFSDIVSRTITVTAPNPPANTKPIAVLNASPTTGVAPLLTTFNANGSSDPDAGDGITGYEWNFGDGSAVSTATAPTHTYTVVGVYTATLRVKDNNNLFSDIVSRTITVTAPNPPANTKPIAVLNASPTTGVAPLLTTFNANGSSDPDAGDGITGYEWNFGDGSAVSTATAPTHTYTVAGVYTATLRVKDNSNLFSDVVSRTITVTSPSTPPASTLTLAQWDFTGKGGQTDLAASSKATAVATATANVGPGLSVINYLANGLTGTQQTATTLAAALTGNDYVSFTVAPAAGKSLTITKLDLRPVSQNVSRTFVVFSSVNGFTSGQQVGTFTGSSGLGAPLTSLTIANHQGLTAPVEFRMYIFGRNNFYEGVGLGNRSGAVGTYDLAVIGSSADVTVAGGTGTIVREHWSNVSGTETSAIPTGQAPTGTMILTSLEGPTNWADNYGARMRGYVIPSTSGVYNFYIAGDDYADLFLSTSADPAGKTKIAGVNGWTNSREWAKYPEQKSATRTLVAGQKYYVEILHKEGSGGDNLAVGWTGPGITTISVIGGNNIAPYVPTSSGTNAGVVRENWNNVGGVETTAIPTGQAPTSTTILTSLEGPTDIGDNYGARVRAYLIPSTSGSYTFYAAGDDYVDLFLSTNTNPANKAKIASVAGWTSSREWTKYPSQKSTTINLVAGQKYYLEILHKEGTGGDNMAIGWTGPGITTIGVIGGSNIEPYVPISGARLAAEETVERLEEIRIFPNPVTSEFTVSGLATASTVEIIGLDGRTIQRFEQVADRSQISVQQLNTGLYLVRIMNTIQGAVTQKIIKQ